MRAMTTTLPGGTTPSWKGILKVTVTALTLAAVAVLMNDCPNAEEREWNRKHLSGDAGMSSKFAPLPR